MRPGYRRGRPFGLDESTDQYEARVSASRDSLLAVKRRLGITATHIRWILVMAFVVAVLLMAFG